MQPENPGDQSSEGTLHGTHEDDGETCLIGAGEGEDFRSTLTPVAETLEDKLKVPVTPGNTLDRTAGDRVRVTPL